MKQTLTFFTTLCFTFLASSLFAQATLDNSFGGTGKILRSLSSGYDYTTATAVQNDGKILVAGYANIKGTTDFVLIRYNTNGTVDTAFGDSGTVLTDFGKSEVAMAMVVQPDGKIILAGQASPVSGGDYALARYEDDGDPDMGFGTGGKVTAAIGQFDDMIQAIALQKDGRIVVAGYSGAYPYYDFSVARFKANGIIDSSFSSDGRLVTSIGANADMANGIAVQSNGKILVSGMTVRGAAYDFAVMRLMPNGDPDFDYGSTGTTITSIGSADDGSYSMVLQPDQKVLLAGFANTGSYNDFAVVRYDTSGVLDNSFSGDGKQTVAVSTNKDGGFDMVLQNDGKILIGGSAMVGMNDDFAFVRLKKNGDPDSTFDNDGKVTFPMGSSNDYIMGIALQTDGNIIAVGTANNGADYDIVVARIKPGNTVGIQELGKGTLGTSIYPNPANTNITLDFELLQSGHVSIHVLDIQGKLICTWVDNSLMMAGQQQLGFSLEGLASGVYMLRVTTMDGTGVVKLVKE